MICLLRMANSVHLDNTAQKERVNSVDHDQTVPENDIVDFENVKQCRP